MAEAIATKADLEAQILALRAEVKADIDILKRDMTIRLGSMMVVAGRGHSRRFQTDGLRGRRIVSIWR